MEKNIQDKTVENEIEFKIELFKEERSKLPFSLYHKIYKNLTFCGKIASTMNANEEKQHHTQLVGSQLGDIRFRN